MGQKINPIALRLGGRIDWNEKSISRTRFKNRPQKYFYRNKLITYIVKSVFKSWNILVSELVIKDKISKKQANKNTNNYLNCNGYKKTNLFKISDLSVSKMPENEQAHEQVRIIEISGLVYKPVLVKSTLRKTGDNELEEVKLDQNKFDLLIEKSKSSRSQSYRTKIILDEINSLIAKLIITYIVNIHNEKNKIEIRFNWNQVSSPLVNSDILSDWIELSLIENSRVMNDRKIFKWLFD